MFFDSTSSLLVVHHEPNDSGSARLRARKLRGFSQQHTWAPWASICRFVLVHVDLADVDPSLLRWCHDWHDLRWYLNPVLTDQQILYSLGWSPRLSPKPLRGSLSGSPIPEGSAAHPPEDDGTSLHSFWSQPAKCRSSRGDLYTGGLAPSPTSR